MSRHEGADGGRHLDLPPNPCSGREEENLPDPGRLVMRIEHWMHHNREHAASYREWAGKVRRMGHEEASRILEQVADDVEIQNAKLGEILALFESRRRDL